uniref:Zinc/iron permease n=1 Tax=Syphacia muris TaxID=451379 RepID=A0A0N5AZ90_9BILA
MNDQKFEIDIASIRESLGFDKMVRNDSTSMKNEPSSPSSKSVVALQGSGYSNPKNNQHETLLYHKSSQDDIVSVSIEVVEQTVIDTAELEIGTVSYMIIFGSTANNFVDGMSNGAAFADSFSRGLSIGIAVIAQQLPQEIGTLAILIKSGLGLKRTLLLALIPNSFSFIGFIVGVLLGEAGDSYETYVFSVSSGMYLYIFLGTLLPEIRDSTNEMIKTDFKESFLTTILQGFGIGVGVTFMLIMSIYGKRISV